ncbi:MAG: PCRF domain-containing protein, partial [Melioribacteraceae bacterium]|nr:PCRF domain-containing protein [Melioribacteraceae bacterium]
MEFVGKLEEIKRKYEKITESLSDPEIVSDQKRYVSLSKERSSLEEIVNVFNEYVEVTSNIEGNKEVIQSAEDKEIKEFAEIELDELISRQKEIEEEIKVLLIPKDPNDDKGVILEIRAGTGGDEAGIFAGDLYRMYTRYAENRGWTIELIDLNESNHGGIKEAVLSLSGEGVFG